MTVLCLISVLKRLLHCLFTSNFFNRKYNASLPLFLSPNMSFSPPAAFKIFSLLLVLSNLPMMCLGIVLFGFFVFLILLIFWDMLIYQIQKFFSHYFLKYFVCFQFSLLSFEDVNIMHIKMLEVAPPFTDVFILFYSIFGSFYC